MKTIEMKKQAIKYITKELEDTNRNDKISSEALELHRDLLENYSDVDSEEIEGDEFESYADWFEHMSGEGYVHEVVDGGVPIMNYKLIEYVAENDNAVDYIDLSIEEYGYEDSFSFIDLIRRGYYEHLNQKVSDWVYVIEKELKK